MAGRSVGTLTIDIVAGIARLEREMAQVNHTVSNAVSGIKSVLASLGIVVSAGVFANLIRETAQMQDETAKMADRLGLSTQALTGLKHAADLAGVSEQVLTTGMRHMASALMNAAQGSGEAAAALRTLGLSATSLIALPMDRQLEIIVERLGSVENATQRNALAADIFGARASEMLNLIAEGGAGIRQATEDTVAWGLALNRVDAAKIEMANDAVTNAKAAFQGMLSTIAVQLAPIIKALADQFSKAARESGGFKSQIISVMESVTSAIGYAANAVHVFRIAWQVLKESAAIIINFLIQAVAALDRVITDALNKLAGTWFGQKLGITQAQYSRFLTEISEVSANRMEEIREETRALANEPWPREQMMAWLDAVKSATEQAAQTIARNRETLRQEGLAAPTMPEAGEDKETKKYIEQLTRRTIALQEALSTERELEMNRFIEREFLLDEARMREILSEEEYHLLSQRLAEEHQNKLTAIEDEALKKRYGLQQVYRQVTIDSVGFFLGHISQLMMSGSKKQFEIGKVAAIAEATINSYQAAVKAYQSLAGIPIVGPAMGAAAAAAAIAFGMAQVQRIRAQSFTGGGAAGGAVPSYPASPITGEPVGTPGGDIGPAPPVQLQAAPRQEVNIQVRGTIFDAETVRQLMESINEQLGDGVNLNVAIMRA